MKYLVLFFAIIGSIECRLATFYLSADCPLNRVWCLKQVVWEYDKLGDDGIRSDELCVDGTNLLSNFTIDLGGDGIYDTGFELFAIVSHNCAEGGQIRQKEIYLSEFGGYLSDSNQRLVDVGGDKSIPMVIVYNLEDVSKWES